MLMDCIAKLVYLINGLQRDLLTQHII